MLRKIKLYGPLAEFLGRRVLEADVASAAEAVRFLVANFPQLESHMASQYYRVSTGETDLTQEELHYPVGQEEIRIVPVVQGAGGNAGLGIIIAGVALIALSAVTFGGSAAFAGAFSSTGLAAVGTTGVTLATGSIALFTAGALLVLGGAALLLAPVPRIDATGPNSQNDPRKSFSFSGIQQTSRQGVPVPIVYGKTLTGSVVISAGIDTVQVKA